MSLDTGYGNQRHKAGKIGQNKAELSERLRGTLSQNSYGKGFSKSYTKYLMHHIHKHMRTKTS